MRIIIIRLQPICLYILMYNYTFTDKQMGKLQLIHRHAIYQIESVNWRGCPWPYAI